jgi:TolB-like protein
VTEPSHAVFLSYASQDVQAAQRICEALRAAGIEVFLDQSELRGGDAWDQKIRHEIHDCVLFIPIVSENTQERLEGYFRHEWKLAIERAHHMAEQKAFLVPVVVDGTRDQEAIVPDAFRAVQWTRLPGGETPPVFVERIQRLLSPEASTPIRTHLRAQSGAVEIIRAPVQAAWSPKRGLLVAAAVAVLSAAAYFAVDKLWIAKPAVSSPAGAASPAPAAFTPPPHSLAVLPFVNMSGDRDQDYFSDGLSEELLNSLARINELQVAARTSSFYFKGEHADLSTIAHKLNVASILEGSVRRSGQTVRVTAQLNNAVTGFHLWSQTYDRRLSDVLRLQTEIANAVANALKVTLLDDVAAKIEIGGTHNPAAFDAYLHASKAYRGALDRQSLQTAIVGYSEAIRLDPGYAVAYSDRSVALLGLARNWVDQPDVPGYRSKAQADARRAIALAPDLAEGHLALAYAFEESLEFTEASREYERALALGPGNAKLLRHSGSFAVEMGRTESGLAAAHRSVVLDPLNSLNHFELGTSLWLARRFDEAIAAFTDVKTLDPDSASFNSWLGFTYYMMGDFESARVACEGPGIEFNKYHCLSLVYRKLGRYADAQTMLEKVQAAPADQSLFVAMVYAQWGDTARALDSLEAAMRHPGPYLEYVKTNPFLDPLRKEPRFRAIERELKFPN